MGYPSVYPTGVTVYDAKKAWGGYTLFQAAQLGALLIDMSGREVQLWKDLQGFPNKLLPGGQLLSSTGQRNPAHGLQDQLDLIQVDWDGEIRWRFSELEQIQDPGEPARWMARQHHDFQRQGNPVGYYVPGQDPLVDRGHTFLLVHENARDAAISEHPLLDDKIVEVSWDGKVVWEWRAREHFAELGFDAAALRTLRADPNLRPAGGGVGDWLHINSLSLLGNNPRHDAGDERFHPDNLVWSSREANILAIIDKRTGKLAWKLGPNFDGDDAQRKLGWIIGPHHAHLVPSGLPGAGNLLVFDNGGWAGYGDPNPGAPTGRQNARRDYSRVLEIDPATLAVRWQYTPTEAGLVHPLDSSRFYSPFISSAQRLPNGNTLITEGSDGRIFEVTAEHELVWEYISPYWGSGQLDMNFVYRAYRAPYDWVPQLPRPEERSIARLDRSQFRVPGAAEPGAQRQTRVAGTRPQQRDADFCVIASTDRLPASADPHRS